MKPTVALLGPDADEDEVREFVAALAAGEDGPGDDNPSGDEPEPPQEGD